MTLAIKMPDGEVIADGDWETVSDVMRASHGLGNERVSGALIEVGVAAAKAIGAFKALIPRCDYSWLYVTECAHCLGHVPDWETKPKVVVYGD